MDRVMDMQRKYIAQAKIGRKWIMSSEHDSREAAAAELFAKHAWLREVQTGHGFHGSFGIEWQRKPVEASPGLHAQHVGRAPRKGAAVPVAVIPDHAAADKPVSLEAAIAAEVDRLIGR
jgi:hypothetical protein